MVHNFNEDDGWGRDSLRVANMLYFYKPDGPHEKAFVATTGKTHERRLFLHKKCTGNHASYTPEHINILLTHDLNPDKLKERLVEMINALPPEKLRMLAEAIAPDALEIVRGLNPKAADKIEKQKQALKTELVGQHTSGRIF